MIGLAPGEAPGDWTGEASGEAPGDAGAIVTGGAPVGRGVAGSPDVGVGDALETGRCVGGGGAQGTSGWHCVSGGGGWLASTMIPTSTATRARMPTNATTIATGVPRDFCGGAGLK
jgi:hypothetical protein